MWQGHMRRAGRWGPVDLQIVRSWCWRRQGSACGMLAGGVTAGGLPASIPPALKMALSRQLEGSTGARVLEICQQVGESTPLALLALSGGSCLCMAAGGYQWGKGAGGHRSESLRCIAYPVCWWHTIAERPCAAGAAAGSAALRADGRSAGDTCRAVGASSLPDDSLATITDVMTLSICLTVGDVANTVQALSGPSLLACCRAAASPALVA